MLTASPEAVKAIADPITAYSRLRTFLADRLVEKVGFLTAPTEVFHANPASIFRWRFLALAIRFLAVSLRLPTESEEGELRARNRLVYRRSLMWRGLRGLGGRPWFHIGVERDGPCAGGAGGAGNTSSPQGIRRRLETPFGSGDEDLDIGLAGDDPRECRGHYQTQDLTAEDLEVIGGDRLAADHDTGARPGQGPPQQEHRSPPHGKMTSTPRSRPAREGGPSSRG